MNRKIVYVLLLILFMALPSYAEKFPVKISPTQIITTKHDSVEVGDWVPFEIVNDVSIGDKLYLKKGTPMQGIVDFIHPNGWAGDSAQITFKTFYTKDADNKSVKISYPLTIDGNVDMANGTKQVLGYFLTCLFRGAEIFIEPDSKIFNVFVTQ